MVYHSSTSRSTEKNVTHTTLTVDGGKVVSKKAENIDRKDCSQVIPVLDLKDCRVIRLGLRFRLRFRFGLFGVTIRVRGAGNDRILLAAGKQDQSYCDKQNYFTHK